MGGWLIVLFVAIYVLSKFGGSAESKAIQGNLVWSFFIWLVTAAIIIWSFVSLPALGYLSLVLSSNWLLAGLFSGLASKFGLVKTSYYLGRSAHLWFRKNPLAGGLYRGFQAAMQLSEGEDRIAALRWLREKFMTRSKPLYSGEIVMFVIIDSLLSRPGDYRYLSKRLSYVNGLPRESIPKSVSLLACKYALAPALADNDWERVSRIAMQWNTPAGNPIAKYLVSAREVFLDLDFDYTGWSKFTDRFKLPRYPAVKNWVRPYLALSKGKNTENSEVSGNPLAWLWKARNNDAVKDASLMENALNDLVSERQMQSWSDRAEELGVWQKQQAWDMIVQSVEARRPAGEEVVADIDDSLYEYLEQQHTALRYIGRSIDQKVEPEITGTGAEHSLDWLNYMETLDNLGKNKSAQLSAFSVTHNSLWNWTAGLWNDKKEHRLAFLVASRAIPYATECELSDFIQAMTYIRKH